VLGGKRQAQIRLAELYAEDTAGRHTGMKARFLTLLDSWMEHQERLARSRVTMRSLLYVLGHSTLSGTSDLSGVKSRT
jgi:hypothetical protein